MRVPSHQVEDVLRSDISRLDQFLQDILGSNLSPRVYPRIKYSSLLCPMVSFSVGVLRIIVVTDMYKALSIHKIRQNTKMPTFYKTLYLYCLPAIFGDTLRFNPLLKCAVRDKPNDYRGSNSSSNEQVLVITK